MGGQPWSHGITHPFRTLRMGGMKKKPDSPAHSPSQDLSDARLPGKMRKHFRLVVRGRQRRQLEKSKRDDVTDIIARALMGTYVRDGCPR